MNRSPYRSLHVIERPKKRGFFRRHLFLLLLSLLALLCAALPLLSAFFPSVAEWLSTRLCAWVRLGLGGVCSLFPFCVSELLVLLAALFLLAYPVFCLVGLIRTLKKKKPSLLLRRLLLTPLTVMLCVLILFCLTFAPSYHRAPLAPRMGLEDPVTEDRLFCALELLVEEINAQVPRLHFNDKGQAILPMSFSLTAQKINGLYNDFSRSHPFLQGAGFEGKRILLSPAMTYTHVSGIYTFFTGESAINTHYPEFLLPYTVAHEYAHQRGIAPENESNFLAFAVLMSSDEPYFRYSAAANVFSSVANAAYSLDKERYFGVIDGLSPALGEEFDAYRAFFKPYEHSEAGKLAEALNDGYLKVNGQSQGTVSYSLITSLVVNYCCDVLQ